METIEQHINNNRKILDDSMVSPQTRRHIESELESLEKYQKNHPNDNHDPTSLELYCNENPDALECKIYEV
jgi:ribosome-associated translation inhibitor RaiA